MNAVHSFFVQQAKEAERKMAAHAEFVLSLVDKRKQKQSSTISPPPLISAVQDQTAAAWTAQNFRNVDPGTIYRYRDNQYLRPETAAAAEVETPSSAVVPPPKLVVLRHIDVSDEIDGSPRILRRVR